MYTRSYYPDSRLSLPENYDGTALLDGVTQPAEASGEVPFARKDEENPGHTSNASNEAVMTGTINIPFLSGLLGKGGISNGLNIKLPALGTEEILIIAAAAFLFFSKNGDKESALILLLLLFVS